MDVLTYLAGAATGCAIGVGLAQLGRSRPRKPWASPFREVLPDLYILAHDGGTLESAAALLEAHPLREDFRATIEQLRDAAAKRNPFVTLERVVTELENGAAIAERTMNA